MDVEESPGCTAADGRSRSVSGATATVTALVEVASDMAEIGANTNTKWRVVEGCSNGSTNLAPFFSFFFFKDYSVLFENYFTTPIA